MNSLNGGYKMYFIQSYYTDIGLKRKSNQDSLALVKANTEYGEVLLAVMCDGMGGHQFGELASKTCVTRFVKWFEEEFPMLLYKGIDFDELKREWRRIIQECNNQLVYYGIRNGIELGSTLTTFLFVQNMYYAVHVGDSRGYLIDSEGVFQITRDHSLVASEVAQGIMTKEEARSDKRTNILLECIGITKDVNIDFYTGQIKSTDSFLLCSDGLWHQLGDNEIYRYLSGEKMKDNTMMRMHLNYLVESVKNRGEKDNISAIGIVIL